MKDRPTILYIEDNADNQRLVKRILEARGYGVQLSESGPDGIALALEGTPSLILVDINIPGLDGYETTTRLRGMAHLHGTPIVALTADSRVGTRERSLVEASPQPVFAACAASSASSTSSGDERGTSVNTSPVAGVRFAE